METTSPSSFKNVMVRAAYPAAGPQGSDVSGSAPAAAEPVAVNLGPCESVTCHKFLGKFQSCSGRIRRAMHHVLPFAEKPL